MITSEVVKELTIIVTFEMDDIVDVYYRFEDDESFVSTNLAITVAKLRRLIHNDLGLPNSYSEYQLLFGGEIPASQSHVRTVIGQSEDGVFLYRKKLHLKLISEPLQSLQTVCDDADVDCVQSSFEKMHMSSPSQFYTALISGSYENGYITWSRKLPIFGVAKIYVRACYIAIYNSIMAEDRKPRNLVTGVPGIGKSYFSLYFAWKYCIDNPRDGFLFEKRVDEIWLFHPNIAFKTLRRADCLQLGNMPYLVDLNEKSLPGENIGLFGVVFSSPCPDRSKEWLKEPNISDRYVMSTWSVEELKKTLADCENTCGIDLETMLKRFRKVGGIPRLVLKGTDDFFESKLSNALAKKGPLISQNFFVGGFGTTDDDASYLLVHMHPSNYNTDFVQYKTWMDYFTFATPYIWEILYQMNVTMILSAARNYFNQGIGAIRGSLAGYQFENLCLRGIPLSGQNLEVRSLSVPSAPPERITFPAMAFLEGDWKAGTLLEDRLYVPKIGNLESGDAFFVQNRIVYLLQITVGEEHPVKANRLKTIGQSLAHLDIEDYRLVFVVPNNGKLRAAQRITTQKGSVATIPSGIVSVFRSNQWRLEYEIPVPEILIQL